MAEGLVHVYTGTGKGKTTAAYGLALRAIGAHKRVLILQFLKPQSANNSSENLAIRQLRPKPKIINTTQYSGWVNKKDKEKNASIKEQINRWLDWLEKEWKSSQFRYDLVILDEINVALLLNLISQDRIISLIKNKPAHLELVLTGRGAPKSVKELADYVTVMKKIKHPFDKGIKARKGIEF